MSHPGVQPRALLLSMPFTSLFMPSLALGTLQAELRRAGIDCDVRYASFDLANRVGTDAVDRLSMYANVEVELVFEPLLYGNDLAHDLEELRAIAPAWFPEADDPLAAVADLRVACADLLDDLVETVPWDSYDLIGFSSMFQQNVASLALATRIKARFPHLTIAFGGANWQGEMGAALHERFPAVDIAATGEADAIIADIVRVARRERAAATVPGIIYRESGRSVSTGPAESLQDLDELPIPDFADWVTQREQVSDPDEEWRLLFESSRGCWWGERSHCTFCGLNGDTMAMRTKSAARVLHELRVLRERHGTSRFMAADTILDMRFFRSLVPALGAETPGFDLFYEVKSNLSFSQVRGLAVAGVRTIQPGIEHLSDHVLDLMGKGVTGLQNIQLLKWATEQGVTVAWNLLYGFPGETDRDYLALADVIDAVSFLPPPGSVHGIMIDRFSPYHSRPQEHGLVDLRPHDVYRADLSDRRGDDGSDRVPLRGRSWRSTGAEPGHRPDPTCAGEVDGPGRPRRCLDARPR